MKFDRTKLDTIKNKYSIVLILLLLFGVSSLINENFLTLGNLSNISRQISVTTILAFGETLLIIAGLIDLSSGSVLAMSGVLSVMTYVNTQNLLLSFLVAVVVSVVFNLLNGIMVERFKAPPFIATLATQTVARGAALLITKGQNILKIGDYTVFGQGSIGVIPTPIIFLVVIGLFTWYLLTQTRFGRALYAIGGNEEAAVASGINVGLTKIQVFLVNGVFVGVASVLFMSRVNAGLPNGAIGYEMEGLTAAIIGGTSFSGGIGTAGGTLAGAFIVGFLNNIMNLTGVDSYVQQIVRGAIIALAVIYDIYAKQSRTKKKLGNLETQKS